MDDLAASDSERTDTSDENAVKNTDDYGNTDATGDTQSQEE